MGKKSNRKIDYDLKSFYDIMVIQLAVFFTKGYRYDKCKIYWPDSGKR
jgi:hypothetical protein